MTGAAGVVFREKSRALGTQLHGEPLLMKGVMCFSSFAWCFLPVHQEVCDPPVDGIRAPYLGELVLQQGCDDYIKSKMKSTLRILV